MTWLFAAFTTVWLAIFFYQFSLDRKQRALRSDLNELKEKLGR